MVLVQQLYCNPWVLPEQASMIIETRFADADAWPST